MKIINSYKDIQCMSFDIDYHSEEGKPVVGGASISDSQSGLYEKGDQISILGAIFTCFEMDFDENLEGEKEYYYYFSLDCEPRDSV